MPTPSYRKATAQDATAISQLWAELFDYHFSLDPLYKRNKDSEKGIQDFLAKAVDDENIFISVAEIPTATPTSPTTKIIGYIWCEIDKKPPCFENRFYGLVSDIAVTKEHRGKGIAQELLKQGLNWFEEKEIKHVEARVLNSNPLATKFWAKSGFEPFVNILRHKG